ncbi:hypothetical protein F2P81_010359 [Scophthalmus maximus]|uniref:Uncharacterized protein n=1 Tax=Scophthalmus maximus TaxID=52904 RepID=A0A6A4SXK5_SCOMX|nr:hypothetical protein F2P81_010359 [Scophthalmus maximus]
MKRYGECSSLTYNVTFENSTMLIEQPFYLKEVYLPTDSSDHLVVYEEVISGKDTFTSLMLFGRRKNVSPVALETLQKQAECLRMPSPIIINPNYEGTYPSSATLLNTGCTDCLVIHSQYTIGGSAFTGLQLLSRRNKVSAAEREEFMKQVDCLNLPAPAFLDPEKDVCPEPPPFEEIDNINFFIDGQRSDIENIMERILSSVGGTENFLKMISEEPSTDV